MTAIYVPAGLTTRPIRATNGRIGLIIPCILTFMMGGLTTGSTQPPAVPGATETPSFNLAQLEIIVLEPEEVSGLGVTASQIEMAFDYSLYLQGVGVTYDCEDATPVGEHWRIACEADSGPRTVVELFGPLDDEEEDEDEEPPSRRDTPLEMVTLFMSLSGSPDENARGFAAAAILLGEILPEWDTGVITFSQWMQSGAEEQEIAMNGKLVKYSNQISTRGGISLSFEPQ